MSDKKPTSKSNATDSREALLQAAVQVFAEKGFAGATVKDLADEAGVNVSLVSYHFGGKEGLYRSCLEGFASERLESTERILSAPTSKEDFRVRLKLFAEEMVDIFQRNRHTCKIVNRGIDSLDPVTLEIFKSVFYRVFGALHGFVESAQRSGFVRQDCDTEISTIFMFGGLMHINRSQDLARALGKRTLDEPVYKTQAIDQWVRNNTEGIFTP